MLRLIIFIIASNFLLVSCKKDFGSYQPVTPTADTTAKSSVYTDGGLLNNNVNTSNGFAGTKWVIVKYNNGFINTFPNDTLMFINNTQYILNNYGVRTYNLSDIAGSTNKSLSINFLTTLGGSNYSGQIGEYSASDGVINNAEFIDYQDVSKKYKVWMKKI